MSRIADTFQRLGGQGRTALIPFLTAGDPQPEMTVPLLHTMVAAGADLLELGIPFSDPMADGPVIQRAAERALDKGISLKQVLTMVAQFRLDDAATPIVLMGYLNPIEAMGYDAFAQAAGAAGVDGIIVVDIPPEEATDLVSALRGHGIDLVFLVAPNTVGERIELIARNAGGFLYYVSLRGVTGAANLDVDEVRTRMEAIRKHTALPVGVGFGIKDEATARGVAEFADAVIIGSAVMRLVEAHLDEPARAAPVVKEFLASIRSALDSAPTSAAVAS